MKILMIIGALMFVATSSSAIAGGCGSHSNQSTWEQPKDKMDLADG